MNASAKQLARRLAACLFAGFVLAIMVGPQEGTLTDFGVAFREAVLRPRIAIFLALGVIAFVLITFWPLVVPYLTRPAVTPLGVGLLTVVIAQTVMNWFDPLANSSGSGKFSAVRAAVDKTPGLMATTAPFFDWLAWVLAGVVLAGCAATIVTRVRPLGYLAAATGLAAAILAYLSHRDVTGAGARLGPDHSLGVWADMIGFLLLAGAGLVAARTHRTVADTRGFLLQIQNYRPGLPYTVLGVVLGLLALLNDCWFGPGTLNATMSASHAAFTGTALSGLGLAFLGWVGWVLFAATAVLALAAVLARPRALGVASALAGVAAGLIGIVLTFLTLHSMTNVGASAAPNNGANWKNLGVGGYMLCVVFALFAGACVEAASARVSGGARAGLAPGDQSSLPAADGAAGRAGPATSRPMLPLTAAVARIRRSGKTRAALLVVIALALFYPPMLPVTWQNVLVGQIGVFVLLAIGLNVVVGWAGLLDLGYIAFYEIGAYATAYLTGALPRKPPEWLHMTPLLAIPFAIVACLIAGVLLGAPTLRLRGDYLAIVTLGFGEIIQVVALNNPGSFTGGPQGPTIAHPRIHIGGWHVTFGEDNLPYWYLLLVMLIVVLILFYRLEGSRLGRAWAAIREDEVAAQASGVNTTRVKLLAFAIGASTSALAGWFFATQVGYFDPTQFTLQASILIVAYVVFGGMGSLPGAMAGAFVLTWLPQFLKDQVPVDDRQMWVGALVLAMMIFRPAGLLPARRRKAELEGLDSPVSSEVSAVPASEGL